MTMRNRAERRATSLKIATRRRRVRLRLWLEYLDRVMTPAPWDRPGGPKHLTSRLFYSKMTLGCGCRGRKHGRPKTALGPCLTGERPSWRQRKAGRQLLRGWATWAGEPIDYEG